MARKRNRVVDEHPSEDKVDEQQQKEEQQTPSKKQLKFDVEQEKGGQEDEAVYESNTDIEESNKAEEEEKKPQLEAAAAASVNVEEDSLEKKGLNNRLWSLNDEILVLQGVIDFKEEFDKDPVFATNSDDFFNFIKDKLEYTTFSKDQVIGKIRKLKKKYVTKLKKPSAGNGKDPYIPNPHELKCFQLSKKIWGNLQDDVLIVKDENEEKKGFVENHVSKSEEEKDIRKLYPHLIKAFNDEVYFPKVMPLYGVKYYLRNADSSVLEEWNEEWKKIHVDEADVYLRKLSIIQEQTKWYLKQIKSFKY